MNSHIPFKGCWEDDFPIPWVGYVPRRVLFVRDFYFRFSPVKTVGGVFQPNEKKKGRQLFFVKREGIPSLPGNSPGRCQHPPPKKRQTFAAPVEDGMMFWEAQRPPRQSWKWRVRRIWGVKPPKKCFLATKKNTENQLPSRELPKVLLSRWFSLSQGGICEFPGG